MLGRGHFVVLRLGQNPQLPQLLVQVLHEGGHSGLDSSKVVVLQLLALGSLGAEQRSAAEPQVRALLIELFVHQEVLLLRAHSGDDALAFGVSKQPQDPHCLAAQVLHGPQQGSLLIQNFAAVRAEGRGNVQGVSLNKGVGGGVPSGVAPGLKGGPQSAGWEGGGIGFAPDQLLAGELHDDPPVGGGGDEAVVLLGSDAIQRLEPVGVMSSTLFHGPVLHGVGHSIGHIEIQVLAFVDGLAQGLIYVLGQPLLHDVVVEHRGTKELGNAFAGFRTGHSHTTLS